MMETHEVQCMGPSIRVVRGQFDLVVDGQRLRCQEIGSDIFARRGWVISNGVRIWPKDSLAVADGEEEQAA